MILTQTQEDTDRIKVLALHGMSQDAWKRFSDDGYNHYQVVEAGFKYNMMDIQAAIGIHQLQRVTPYWNRRQQIWQQYNQALADLPLTLPTPQPQTRCMGITSIPSSLMKAKRGLVVTSSWLPCIANILVLAFTI